MKKWLILLLVCIPLTARAETPGMQGIDEVRQCIMQNDIEQCHKIMTVGSYGIFDRFFSYKLMPCLPTDFTYESEQATGNETIVTASMPASDRKRYVFHLVFAGQPPQVKIDIPETFHVGLGENWKNKVDVSEQLFLLMRQNLKDKLTCDMLRDLATPHRNKG